MFRAYDSSEGRVDGPNPNASGENAPLLIDARRAQMCTFAEIAGQRRDAETPGFAECEFPGIGSHVAQRGHMLTRALQVGMGFSR